MSTNRGKWPCVALVLLVATVLSGCFPNIAGQRQQAIKTDPVFGSNGMKIAFVSTHDGDAEIFVMNADGSNLKKLTDNSALDAAPNWSPDGSRIIFVSDRDGKFELYIMNADGTQQELLPTPVGQLGNTHQ